MSDDVAASISAELQSLPPRQFRPPAVPAAAQTPPPPAPSSVQNLRDRRRRPRWFWIAVIVLPWVVTVVIVASRPDLHNFTRTGLAVTRPEATWLAAWVLVTAAVVVSGIVRRYARAPADRDTAEQTLVNANRTTQETAKAVQTLPLADTRSPAAVSMALGSQQTALTKRDLAIVAERRSGLRGLIVGTDGRVSTSKVQAMAWTAALLYAFIYLLLAGWHIWRRPGTPALTPLVDGFAKLIKHPLQPEYLILLGIPVTAAVAAKALVTNKILRGDLTKTTGTSEGVLAGAAEVVSNDAGSADLLDFQYAAFNTIALVYFFVTFLGTTAANPEAGLPGIPATLLGLSGVSAATYLAKKSLETGTAPAILEVAPRLAVLQRDLYLTVTGSGFCALTPSRLNAVMLGGVPLAADQWSSTSVVVGLPPSESAARLLGLSAGTYPLVVTDDEGNDSAPFLVQLAAQS